jgi:hypothetical protein
VAHVGEEVAERRGTLEQGVCASLSMRPLPQRSQVIRMNHEGNAASGSSRASRAVGRHRKLRQGRVGICISDRPSDLRQVRP